MHAPFLKMVSARVKHAVDELRSILRNEGQDLVRQQRAGTKGPEFPQYAFERIHSLVRRWLEDYLARNPDLTPTEKQDLCEIAHTHRGQFQLIFVSRFS